MVKELLSLSGLLRASGGFLSGHHYITEALAKGAAALLVKKEWLAQQSKLPPVPCVAVENTLVALQAVASWWRARLPALNLIGITGSVGKTSTKELTAAVLSQSYQTFKSPKSFNNEYSLMPVLLELQAEHEQAVIEMGCGCGLGELTPLPSSPAANRSSLEC